MLDTASGYHACQYWLPGFLASLDFLARATLPYVLSWS